MINLAVINIKELKILLKKIIIFIIIGICFLKSIQNFNLSKISLSRIDFKAEKIISRELLLAKYCDESFLNSKNNNYKKILFSELSLLSEIEKELMEKENMEELKEEVYEEYIETEKNDLPPNKLDEIETNVISEKNKKDVYTDVFGSVKIKNESKYMLNEEMVIGDYNFSNKKDIIIFHTHTCESYTQTETSKYVPSGNFRTTDLNYSVAKARRSTFSKFK